MAADELRELAGLMESRANVYGLLSRCFEVEIDAGFAAELSGRFEFDSDDEALASELSGMCEALAGIDEDGLEQLAVVFDRAFYGMGPRTAQKAFPYESVYTSDRGIMMQDAYIEARRAYREHGLAKDESFTEPDDHIAVELAFMRELASRCKGALEQGDDEAAAGLVGEQRAFLADHLLNWAGRFAVDLEKSAEGGFYVHLARFTARFLRLDAGMLADMVDE